MRQLNVAQDQRDIAKEQLRLQHAQMDKKLTEDEAQCLQLFRLATSEKDATYEWYKDRVEDRVEGTCTWVLEHDNFQTWLRKDTGPLLVSADPGCGKSVLAKHLIEHVLPSSATVCYFFFKDQDQSTARQALCALLHQLFRKIPSLIKHAMTLFREEGRGLVNSTRSLWSILRGAVQDNRTGPVIIVLDALDECDEVDFKNVVRNIQSQFHSSGGESELCGSLRYLLTSRPYDRIISQFHDLLDIFPTIRIPGEHASETISKEIDFVIEHRVEQLSRQHALAPAVKSALQRSLHRTTHRTYLWVYLVFDYLEDNDFKKTPAGVMLAINTLPASVNDAYEKILSKCKDHFMVKKVVSAVLAAYRPLTLEEANVVLNMDEKVVSINDVDMESEVDFKKRLRSWCGLFISVHHGRVYFLHQTAREFLVDNSTSTRFSPRQPGRWHRSIPMTYAHGFLAKACVICLSSLDSNILRTRLVDLNFPKIYALLEYAAMSWSHHFRQARDAVDGTAISHAQWICGDNSDVFSIWISIYRSQPDYIHRMRDFTGLIFASFSGLDIIVQLLLGEGAEVDSQDALGRTSLSWAAQEGHEAIVKLLIEAGAELDSKDRINGHAPLYVATVSGHETIVKLLLEAGANANSTNHHGQRSLFRALDHDNETIMKLLLGAGAEVDFLDGSGQTSLLRATCDGKETMVKLLLEAGAEVDFSDRSGHTSLSKASYDGKEAIVNLLLGAGANVNLKNYFGQTPLAWAICQGNESIVKILLDAGAEVDLKNGSGQTPLSRAVDDGRMAIAKLLLKAGAKVDLKDGLHGRTPLIWAIQGGHEAIVKLLIAAGAEVNLRDDQHGHTPLQWAFQGRHAAIFSLMIRAGAKMDLKMMSSAKDHYDGALRTPDAMTLLLDERAEVDSDHNLQMIPYMDKAHVRSRVQRRTVYLA